MTCILDHRPIPTRLWLQPISRTNGASFSSPVYVSKKAFMLQRLEAKIPPPPSLDIHSCHLDRPPCHLERSERSHAAIIRSEKSILGTTRLLASLRNDSGGCISANALSGTTNFRIRPSCTVIAAFLHCRLRPTPLSSRPSPTAPSICIPTSSTFPRGHLDLPPLSSRPSPAVISNAVRDLLQPLSVPGKASSATRDFSLRFEMTAGAASRPSPYRERRTFAFGLPALSSRPSCTVASGLGRHQCRSTWTLRIPSRTDCWTVGSGSGGC